MSIGRLLTACGFTEITPSTKPFDDIERTPGTVAVIGPSRMGKTAAMERALLVKLEPTQGVEPVDTHIGFNDVRGDFPILTVSMPYERTVTETLRDAVESLSRNRRRPGDTMFGPEALKAMERAGCSIEERDGGAIIIHLPSGGEVPGIALSQLMGEPVRAHELQSFCRGDCISVEKAPAESPQPDYLKHDPTKRHSRRKRR